MRRLLPLVLVVGPALALAQEAKKFNAKELEKDFAPLPVYAQRGAVVDNEVVLSSDESRDLLQAVYVVKADVKKVNDFYAAKMSVKAERKGDDTLGTVKYVFQKPIKKGDQRVYRVTVEPLDEPGRVQISLLRRAVTEDDPVVEEGE
jgi:hypothetical protein